MELYCQAGGEAESAGTKVDAPGTTLAERPGAVTIMNSMREAYGIEMIHTMCRQVTPQLTAGFNKLLGMAELETVPAWLAQDPRSIFWTIDDPKGQDIETTKRIVGEVKAKVDALTGDI